MLTNASSQMMEDQGLQTTVRELYDENSRLAQEMDRLLAEYVCLPAVQTVMHTCQLS